MTPRLLPREGGAAAAPMPESVVLDHGMSASSCGYCDTTAEDTFASHGMWVYHMSVGDYQGLLDRGWRRSGQFMYKPEMAVTCCPPYTIRLPAKEFAPTKGQRKLLRKFERHLAAGLERRRGAGGDARSQAKGGASRRAGAGARAGSGAADAAGARLAAALDEAVQALVARGALPSARYPRCTVRLRGGGSPGTQVWSSPSAHAIAATARRARSALVAPHASAARAPQQDRVLDCAAQVASALHAEWERLPHARELGTASVAGEYINIACEHAAGGRAAADLPRSAAAPAAVAATDGGGMHCDDLHSAGAAVARQGKHAQSADADAPPMSPHGAKRSRATLRDSPRAANQPGAEAMDVQGGSSAQEEAGTRGPLELTVTTHRSAFDEEEYQLYRRYQIAVHESSLDELERSHYERFLVDTPLTFVPPDAENGTTPTCGMGSFHQQYRLGDRLVAVGVVDILPSCLSSKYLFWDPDLAHLGLGKVTALKEVEWVASQQEVCPSLKYYYLGYYIHTCPKMTYKAEFAPSELLCPATLQWVPFTDARPVLDRDGGKSTRLLDGMGAGGAPSEEIVCAPSSSKCDKTACDDEESGELPEDYDFVKLLLHGACVRFDELRRISTLPRKPVWQLYRQLSAWTRRVGDQFARKALYVVAT